MPRPDSNRFIRAPQVRLPLLAPLVLALALVTAAALAGAFTASAQSGVPTITRVEIYSSPTSGTSYRAGAEIFVKIAFSAPVFLSGNGPAGRPQLKLSIGGVHNRTADFLEATPQIDGVPNLTAAFLESAPKNVLHFAYHITAADQENYGISIANQRVGDQWVTPLSMPAGGRITGPSGAPANLDLGAHAITRAYGHRVNATTPEPPANVRAKPVANGIVIIWEQPGHIVPDRYAIERRAPDDRNAAVWFWVDDSSVTYTDTADLIPGRRYEYRVKGYQRSRQGIPQSSRISAAARVQYTPPPPPTPTPDDTASSDVPTTASPGWAAPLAMDPTHNSVTVYWHYTVNSVGSLEYYEVSPTANGYRLYRRAADAVAYISIAQLPLSQTSYQDTGLQPDTTYTYRIYEDHPQRLLNLVGDLTFTTAPAPTPPPTPDR